MLPCVCSVIDHRRRQNVVRTSVTHSAIASCATFLFLPHFDVICDLLLNRRTATWNLFVKLTLVLLTCFLSFLVTKGSRVLEKKVNGAQVSNTVFSHLKQFDYSLSISMRDT